MSLTIATTRSVSLPLRTAQQIRDTLTKPNSQTNQDMGLVISGILGNTPADLMPDFPLSVATIINPYTDESECIGWASATVWNRISCLQAFVAQDYRRKGLATALAVGLVIDNHLSPDMPIGVFSDECALIAFRLGFTQTQQYKLVDDGWIRVETAREYEQRRRETDQVRVLNAETTLRHLPLADCKTGQVDGGSPYSGGSGA